MRILPINKCFQCLFPLPGDADVVDRDPTHGESVDAVQIGQRLTTEARFRFH